MSFKPLAHFPRLSKVLTVGLLFSALLSLGGTALAGPKDGGGGSEEARMFAAAARKAALKISQSEPHHKYARQLVETLDRRLEIQIVHSLDSVCDGKAKGKKLYAYSCRGQINLLSRYWSNEGEFQWLKTAEKANEHVKDIVHEVFRAGDRQSPAFVTNDEGYSKTEGPLANLLRSGSKKLCPELYYDCNNPIDEPVIDFIYACNESGDTLNLNLLTQSGSTQSIPVGGGYMNLAQCQAVAAERQSLPLASAFGPSYKCSLFSNGDSESLKVVLIEKDFTWSSRNLVSTMDRRQCLELADRKWRQSRAK